MVFGGIARTYGAGIGKPAFIGGVAEAGE